MRIIAHNYGCLIWIIVLFLFLPYVLRLYVFNGNNSILESAPLNDCEYDNKSITWTCVLTSCAAVSSRESSFWTFILRPFLPFVGLYFDRGQALWNIIILIITITSNTARDLEQNPMAWQARTNLQPSRQAKYFLCPITGAHCFLSRRQCHPMAPCFPQAVFPVLEGIFMEKKIIHSRMKHSHMPCLR